MFADVIVPGAHRLSIDATVTALLTSATISLVLPTSFIPQPWLNCGSAQVAYATVPTLGLFFVIIKKMIPPFLGFEPVFAGRRKPRNARTGGQSNVHFSGLIDFKFTGEYLLRAVAPDGRRAFLSFVIVTS